VGEVFLTAAREILLRLQQASAAALHAESGEAGTIRLGFIPTASFHILPRLLAGIRSTLPLVNVELKEGSEDPQITGLHSGVFDVCIGHLSRTYDQIENMLLIRERLVVLSRKGIAQPARGLWAQETLKVSSSSCPRKICYQVCIN
jgi:DNA-binding transcriptional LysR family regulator